MIQAALDLAPMPLNQENWDFPSMVEDVHEGMFIHNLRILRDSKPGSEQWVDIMGWLDAPLDARVPFSFAACCRVMGIEDPEATRETIKKFLN